MVLANVLGFIFSLLETYLFIGVFYGWHEINRVLKDEKVFGDKCVYTNHTVGSVAVDFGVNNSENITWTEGSGGSNDVGHLDCTEQDQEFQRIFLIGYALGMILSFPLGLCLDRLGSVPTRLMAGLVYTLGWTVLACYQTDEYCTYAWVLLSISGFTMLISNYKSMNYYAPSFVGTAMTLLCGVFDSSASMGKILGLIYDGGVPLSSICISMAVLSLVLITTITLLLHPYIKPPEPLPEVFSVIDYSFLGYALGRTTQYNADLTSQSDIIDDDTQEDPAIEQDSESAPLIQKTNDEQTLIQSICSLDYIFSVVWYLILCVRMSSWFAWMHPWSLTLDFTHGEMVEFNYIKGFFFYFSIPIAAIPGAIVDTCSSVAKSSSAGVITTLVVASLGAALMSGLQSASVGHLVIAETSVFFGVLARTFTYGSYAVFINSTFKTEYFASIMGLTSVFVGLISLVNDALFAYIISEDGLNSNFHPVDIGFTIACCLSLIQPVQMTIRRVRCY